MKHKVLATAIMSICMTLCASSFAQYYDRPNNQVIRVQGDHGGNHGNYARGAGPRNDMYRGGRLPRDYRGNQYVVDDWRGHHLSAPPRGHHWVQTGSDYVLVGIATGIILNMSLY